MPNKCSANSACLNHLGRCVVTDPDDVATFEENLRNPIAPSFYISNEAKLVYKRVKESFFEE